MAYFRLWFHACFLGGIAQLLPMHRGMEYGTDMSAYMTVPSRRYCNVYNVEGVLNFTAKVLRNMSSRASTKLQG